MEIRATGPSDAYARVIGEVLEAPVNAPRGLKVREIPERVSIVIERPFGLVRSERRLNHAISVVEGLSLLGQCSVPELQTSRVLALSHFMSGGVFRGSYGPRIEGSLSDLVRLLVSDKDTRQAVLTIYNSQRDLGRWNEESVSGDVPCTLAIQFLSRDDYLHMWVTMRSNDAWRGLPYDLGQFVFLHHAIAQAIGNLVGTYTHTVGSMHLYEEHWEQAEETWRPWDTDKDEKTEWPVFGNTLIPNIAIRARKILLGQSVEDETPHEHWMASCLAMADHKQILEW